MGRFVFKKRKESKLHHPNIIETVFLIIAVFCICLLLKDNIMPLSINSVWHYFISHWGKHFHIVAVGLLPIYVALMVFGTAIFSVYTISVIRRWLKEFLFQRKL